MSEVKCKKLLISKADLEELNSQMAQKNASLSSEIEQLKVICFLALLHFLALNYGQYRCYVLCLVFRYVSLKSSIVICYNSIKLTYYLLTYLQHCLVCTKNLLFKMFYASPTERLLSVKFCL